MYKLYEEFERRKATLTCPNLLRLRCNNLIMQSLSRRKHKVSFLINSSWSCFSIMSSLVFSQNIKTVWKVKGSSVTKKSIFLFVEPSKDMQHSRLKTYRTPKLDSTTSTLDFWMASLYPKSLIPNCSQLLPTLWLFAKENITTTFSWPQKNSGT